MRELGDKPGKEREEFICSSSCHISLVFVLMETGVSSRALPSRKTPPNDLEPWGSPSLPCTGCPTLMQEESNQFFQAELPQFIVGIND